MMDFNQPGSPANAGLSPEARHNVERLKECMRGRMESVLSYLLPAGKVRSGKFYVGDVQGNPGDSMVVELTGPKAGMWYDHATGQGSDIINLWAAVRHLDTRRDFPKILDEIASWLGEATSPVRSQPAAKPDRHSPLGTHKDHGFCPQRSTAGSNPGACAAPLPGQQTLDKTAQTTPKHTPGGIWAACAPAPADHAYLQRKVVQAFGLRLYRGPLVIAGMACNGALVVPLVDATGKLVTLQFISPGGDKRFLPGCPKKGAFHVIGSLTEIIVIAEGFATAASVHQATGYQTIVAVDAGNLQPVDETVREQHPHHTIVIAADDDIHIVGNPGRSKAEEAARSIGGFLALPDFGSNRPDGVTDFNDLAQLHGQGAVKKCIGGAQRVPVSTANDNDWPEITHSTVSDTSEPFPIDTLPTVLRDAAMEIARFTKTDVASAAVVGLSVAATAIGKGARVEEKSGLLHNPAMFFIASLDSGERKTPVFQNMTYPLEQWAKAQEEHHVREVARAQAENAVIDGLLGSMKRQALKASNGEREILVSRMAEEASKRKEIPASPRLFTSDVTEEKLFQKLHAHGGEFAVMSGEGRQVIDAILGRYSGGNRTGDGIYLAGISGDTICRDRVGNEKSGPEDLAIIQPCLNVCIMVQPDKFMELLRNPVLTESGLVARILPVSPASMVGSRFEEPDEQGLNEYAMEGYNRTIGRFLNAKRLIDPMTGGRKVHLAVLGAGAKEARRQWHNIIEREMGVGHELEKCRDIAAKSVTQTVKIALVLHLLENPDYLLTERSEISLATWKGAQRLIEMFLATAIRFRESAQTVACELASDRIVEWLQITGRQTVSNREVLRVGPRPRMKNINEVNEIFDELQDRGVVRKDPSRNGWLVNPGLFKGVIATVAVSPI
ncbi:MAG: DUF3987 domain-containing protein [Magnetococcales bacterium]|nr:DUF3987 domain-containing protein [Magnetococcales bacterium]